MKEDEVARLLTLRESEDIELKDAHERIPLSFYESYSAMANGSGGHIYLGIIEQVPTNIISGVQNALQKKNQLCHTLTLKSKIANADFLSGDVRIIPTAQGDVIEVYVRPVKPEQRPVYLDGDPQRAYKRVSEGDKLFTPEDIQTMINDAAQTKFDQRGNEFGFDLTDMDPDAVSSFIQAVKDAARLPSVRSLDEAEIMNRVGATSFDKEKGKLVMTNGAVLFFGKSYAVTSVAPNLWLDYQEKDPHHERFINRMNNRDLIRDPNIFQFFRRVYPRLCELAPSPFYLREGVNVGRTLMEETIREALANALSNVSVFSPLGVTIVKNPFGVCFQNAGGMPTGLEQARKGGVSIPRNPCIFGFFLALGVTDHGGYGVPKIFDNMKDLGFAQPELTESWNRDMTTLVLSAIPISPSLTEEEQKILVLLGQRPEGVSTGVIADALSFSGERVRQLLIRLMEMGLVVDNGKGTKGRRYILKPR